MSKCVDILAGLGLPPFPSLNADAISTMLWARQVLQQHSSKNYAVKNSVGIEEVIAIDIGTTKQWLHIRSRNRDNPVLLFIHGGPGGSMIGCMDSIQRPWEDYFTVVQWDQRQTGKSYYPADDANSPLHISDFIEDTKEVIQYIQNRLSQEKIFAIGHSWGSVLGLHVVKNSPEWFHAFVGVGQVVNQLAAEIIMYKRLLTHARHSADYIAEEKAVSILSVLENDQLNNLHKEKAYAENCGFVREYLSNVAGEAIMHKMSSQDLVEILNFEFLISPHINVEDIINKSFGDEPALIRAPYSNLTKDFLNINLPDQLGSSFDVPIFFLTGRHDYQTPSVLSERWLSDIKAPYKKFVYFEDSSHMVINEEPGRFLNVLVNDVLPFAKSLSGKTIIKTKVDPCE